MMAVEMRMARFSLTFAGWDPLWMVTLAMAITSPSAHRPGGARRIMEFASRALHVEAQTAGCDPAVAK